MVNKKCTQCALKKRCQDNFTSWFFFIVGVIATIAIRIGAFLMHLSPVWSKVSWYVGVGGFFVFFLYKFKLLLARSRQIDAQHIIQKIEQRQTLADADYALLEGILCSIASNKERINYFIIFGVSAIALAVAVYFDFFQ